MNDALAQSVLAYIKDKHVMTLVTTGPEGPWAAAVFFVNDGFEFYFLSAPSTRHGENMSKCSQVAATIQLDYDNWQDIKGVQLEGEINVLNGAAKAAAMACYAKKFPVIQTALKAPSAISKAMAGVTWYKLVPRRLYFIDNAKGFGHRDKVKLSQ